MSGCIIAVRRLFVVVYREWSSLSTPRLLVFSVLGCANVWLALR